MSEMRDIQSKPRPNAQMRATFYQLYEDVIEQLNVGVKFRTRAGVLRRELAAQADQDPGFLSRILSGNGGTNLRSIAAVLYAVQGRFDIRFVPLEREDHDPSGWVRIGRSVSLQCHEEQWLPVLDTERRGDHAVVVRKVQTITYTLLDQ